MGGYVEQCQERTDTKSRCSKGKNQDKPSELPQVSLRKKTRTITKKLDAKRIVEQDFAGLD